VTPPVTPPPPPGDPRCAGQSGQYYYYSYICTASDDANAVSFCGEDGVPNQCAGGSGAECGVGCGGPPGGRIY
jgi:hypothetical protein